MTTIEENQSDERDSEQRQESGERPPPIHAQVIEEMDEINRIQSAIDSVQFQQANRK